jgi:thiamine biosynthesis protein ThiS
MTLHINGESRSVPSVSNLMELVTHLGIVVDRVAIELNRQIIRRKDWESTPLREMDKIEIVQFVGGG